jgi:hypothetical protein
MTMGWESIFDGLKGDLANNVKREIAGLIGWAKSDSEDFINKQGRKVEKYLDQLALGEITPEQLEGYMHDIVLLTEMQKSKMKVAEQASAQRLIDGIKNHILDRMIGLL